MVNSEDEDSEDTIKTERFRVLAWMDLDQYTVCALAIHCPKHDTMALMEKSTDLSTALWLPYILVQKDSIKWTDVDEIWSRMSLELFTIKQENNPKIQLHSMTRIQLPNGGEFIERLIYIGQWPMTNRLCCQTNYHHHHRQLLWVPFEQLLIENDSKSSISQKSINSRLWGSEVITYASILKKQQSTTICLFEQTGQVDVFKYVHNSNFEHANFPSSPKELFQKFLKDSKFSQKEVLILYNEYVRHCYPSLDMSFHSFKVFAKRKSHISCVSLHESLNNNKQFPLLKIFKAMNYKLKNYIGFNEFLIGMVSMDPYSANSEPRHMFLFRYYSSSIYDYLTNDDIQQLKKDLSVCQLSSNQNIIGLNGKLNFETFSKEISDSGNLRVAEFLCRLKKPVVEIVQGKTKSNVNHCQGFGPKLSRNCQKCRTKNYSIAIHSLHLDLKTGRLMDPKEIDLKSLRINTNLQQHKKNIVDVYVRQRHSCNYIFNGTTVANYVLDLIRKLSGLNQMTEESRKNIQKEVIYGLSVSVIKTICDEVWDLLSVESRVLKLSTPTIVMGDIHGNINDLLIFESQLWPMAPMAQTAHVLFLGDYVDRGESSIEVIMYLFSIKILSPCGFSLLRGNHEIRSIQRTFTFERECLEKYGRHGEEVFEMFNKVFDILPFAAVLDERIYCAHGGIPFTLTKIEDLIKLPIVLRDPEQEAPPVWEILWSDPMTNEEFHELSEFMNKSCNGRGLGYLSNLKRSTAFYFAEKATKKFLEENHLTHVIRAHEAVNDGFKFNHHGTVITVFSCSRYCTGTNKAAAIIVEAFNGQQHKQQGFIKVLSLDT